LESEEEVVAASVEVEAWVPAVVRQERVTEEEEGQAR